QADLIRKYATENLRVPGDVQARVDKLQKQIDRIAAKRQRFIDQHASMERRRREEITRTLEVEPGHGVKFDHEDLPSGYNTGEAKLEPLQARARENVHEAEAWLGRMVAKGDNDAIHARIGEADFARAHWSNAFDHMQVGSYVSPATVVHEYGHAI